MAMAARYWINTTGAVEREIGCVRQRERISEPAGETQMFDPRPRPASWVVAVNVKPAGRRVRRLVFLRN